MAPPPRVSPDSPRARQTPMETECDVYAYEDIPGMLLRPDKYFPHGVSGVNVILPDYDPTAIDPLRFFGIQSNVPSLDFSKLIQMSDEELAAFRGECQESLEQCQTELIEKSRIVIPFDVDSKDIIAIKHDVRTFDWNDLASVTQFDVILMDPPWKIQTPGGTRCLELRYELMPFDDIAAMPIPSIQADGFIFLWVVVSMFDRATTMLADWGYRIVTDINWVKCSRKGKYQPSNGFYLQHAKETCLVAVKGIGFDGMRPEKLNDLIIRWRNIRQSHKPDELYKSIEETFPGGLYLELFARAHNLRPGWVSIGLELPK
jgi:N6-adenosine-specific RNA methylase IME4